MQTFHKYHGAGNDFIIIDNRDKHFDIENIEHIKTLCHRRFGIGADGMLLLQDHPEYDFEMVYLNSDGSIGSMCGNGGRCIVHYAHFILGVVSDPEHVTFLAVDGEHHAQIVDYKTVRLKMQDAEALSEQDGLPFMHSGTTPHHIQYVVNLEQFPVVDEARKIREQNNNPKGVNVNYVEPHKDGLAVRTYERGVEDETLACGTGATCVAIASYALGKTDNTEQNIYMPGGMLTVSFEEHEGGYTNIWLTGPAVCSFEGEWK